METDLFSDYIIPLFWLIIRIAIIFIIPIIIKIIIASKLNYKDKYIRWSIFFINIIITFILSYFGKKTIYFFGYLFGYFGIIISLIIMTIIIFIVERKLLVFTLNKPSKEMFLLSLKMNVGLLIISILFGIILEIYSNLEYLFYIFIVGVVYFLLAILFKIIKKNIKKQ